MPFFSWRRETNSFVFFAPLCDILFLEVSGMKKSVASLFALNRRVFLLLGGMPGLRGLGVSAYR